MRQTIVIVTISLILSVWFIFLAIWADKLKPVPIKTPITKQCSKLKLDDGYYTCVDLKERFCDQYTVKDQFGFTQTAWKCTKWYSAK